MKRLIWLCLSALFVFSMLCGCVKKPAESSYEVDVAYFLSVGQIKEAPFALGASLETVAKAENKSDTTGVGIDHETTPIPLDGDTYCGYQVGSCLYYGNKNAEKSTVAFIADLDEAYGFEVGISTKEDIKRAIPSLTPTIASADSRDLFFMMFMLDGCEKMVYTDGKYQLSFIFSDNLLVCTTICDTELWNG